MGAFPRGKGIDNLPSLGLFEARYVKNAFVGTPLDGLALVDFLSTLEADAFARSVGFCEILTRLWFELAAFAPG